MQQDNNMLQDPFNSYGFGIIAWFQLMKKLILTFFVLSLLAGINMYIFSKGNALENESKGMIAGLTMGNLGFSGSKCLI